MRKIFTTISILALAASALVSVPAASQEVNPDSWVATDALGRKVRSYDNAPAKRDGKFVAIFYWTWHTFHHDEKFPVYNISEILREHPEAIKDYNHPAWGPTGPHYYYWEQPLFGYYRPSVLPKAEELLSSGRRSMGALLASVGLREVSLPELGEGPDSPLLRNLNVPEDYEKLRLELGS